MRIRLTGGAYTARSIISSAQRQVNLFSERGLTGSIIDGETGSGVGDPVAGGITSGLHTLYPAPGLLPIGTPPPPGPARGLYWANNDQLFYVCGETLYFVDADFNCNPLGTIAPGTTPVSMGDNGQTMVLVDGTPDGYQVTLAGLAFAPINDLPTPAGNAPTIESTSVYGWLGSDRVAVQDGFMIFNQPATQNFYITYNAEVVFDALYIAAKNGYSDNLVAAVVSQRTIWLIGERTTEIWFNAAASGATDFPFAIIPGAFMHHGCCAKYSIAQIMEGIYWLSQDQGGANILVHTSSSGTVSRVSTHAIEVEWATYPQTSDATAFTFQQGGHSFYQINFPSGDKSWRYDEQTGEWHEAVWSDVNGTEHRHRAQCAAFAYGKVVCADWETGALYALDPGTFTDAGAPIVRIRGFPHVVADGDRVFYQSIILDMAAGNSVGTTDPPGDFPALSGDTAPQVLLEWSDDRGRTWSNPISASMGATGEYLTSIQFTRLGMARDRVFQVTWDAPVDTALQGAFLTFAKAAS